MILILAIGALMAVVNGANDVSKGVATLAGSGVAGYRRAILWGAAWTAVGGLAASVFAGAMVTSFGSVLLRPGTSPSLTAAVSTILGAAAWVLVATRTGWPVSTTHAIVGSLAGIWAFAYGVDGVRWSVFGGRIFLPLFLSPVLALVLTVFLVRVIRRLAGPPAGAAADCLCADVAPCQTVAAGVPGIVARAAVLMPGTATLRLAVGDPQSCAVEHPGAFKISLDHVHWLTSGASSFARGMNDAPKMVALILAASALTGGAQIGSPLGFGIVTLGMVAGSIAAGTRVTRFMAERLTVIGHRDGLLASLVTSLLVTTGAVCGAPMSTTHVSAGAIAGVGVGSGGSDAVDWRAVRGMLLAWFVTLPAAASLAVLSYLMIRMILV